MGNGTVSGGAAIEVKAFDKWLVDNKLGSGKSMKVGEVCHLFANLSQHQLAQMATACPLFLGTVSPDSVILIPQGWMVSELAGNVDTYGMRVELLTHGYGHDGYTWASEHTNNDVEKEAWRFLAAAAASASE